MRAELEAIGLIEGKTEQDVAEQIEIQVKYEGYIARQQLEVERQLAQESTEIPSTIDYGQVAGLSAEVRQKLSATRPATLGQASRISGVTPAAISLLMIHLKRIRQSKPMASSPQLTERSTRAA